MTKPEWASVFASEDATCKVCGEISAASFTACIYCCKHDELSFTEQWDGGWVLGVECSI